MTWLLIITTYGSLFTPPNNLKIEGYSDQKTCEDAGRAMVKGRESTGNQDMTYRCIPGPSYNK